MYVRDNDVKFVLLQKREGDLAIFCGGAHLHVFSRGEVAPQGLKDKWVVIDNQEGYFYFTHHGPGQPNAISTGDAYSVVFGRSPGVRPAPKTEEDNISGARRLASAACIKALLL